MIFICYFFTYYIDNGNSFSWNADENQGTARTYILWSDGTEDYSLDPTGLTSHIYQSLDAFTLQTTPTREITGFWISKFEAGGSNLTTTPSYYSNYSFSLNVT